MPDLTTVTGCINAQNYSQGIDVAADVMPGNQSIQDALVACQTAAKAVAAADAAALKIAAGN
jgi:hypothetical protein